jgi:hypothetical protein
VVEIEFVENGQTVLVRFTKGLLALDREPFVQGLRRGKKHERSSSLAKRMTPVPYDVEFPQAPQAVSLTNGNDIVCDSAAEHEVDRGAKEGVMAVWLTIELPASEIGETGYLRGIDYLQLPASHVKVVALEADGTWIGVREWSALEAPPPYQRARVEVSLEPGPTPLTAKNVVTLAKGAQAMLDNFGAARR